MTNDPSHSYHYGVVRRALEIIDATGGAGPSLEDLAAAMDMSPAHLQRVFSRWAGLSPKRYGQYLALDHAKTLLRERFTTLETAQITGLSGTGRLHVILYHDVEPERPGYSEDRCGIDQPCEPDQQRDRGAEGGDDDQP